MNESAPLVRYDSMCRAIAEAYEVDEVKDIRDKALALEVYARQARNIEADQQACEIRLRAERTLERLLKKGLPHRNGSDGMRFDPYAANNLIKSRAGELDDEAWAAWQEQEAAPCSRIHQEGWFGRAVSAAQGPGAEADLWRVAEGELWQVSQVWRWAEPVPHPRCAPRKPFGRCGFRRHS